jgi:16S rRNA (uracil1498-N3)-methyltransferase
MQRYFIENDFEHHQVTITGDDVHHITKVMRMTTGETIICCNADGKAAICEIEEITTSHVIANVVEWVKAEKELPVLVTIAQALPKGDKLEYVVQKGTELGASHFIPFTAKRSVVKWDDVKVEKKVKRLQKIAKEAAEQSHRLKVPEVNGRLHLNELIKASAHYDVKIVAYEESAKAGESKNLARALSNMKKDDTMIAVFGPEGGFLEEEIQLLTEHGFVACSLGPRILRAETAPMYVLSAVSYHTELLG